MSLFISGAFFLPVIQKTLKWKKKKFLRTEYKILSNKCCIYVPNIYPQVLGQNHLLDNGSVVGTISDLACVGFMIQPPPPQKKK